MAMFKHYITLAFRNLSRNKFQSAFSIIGLAVAFFCFGICMYFVHGLLSMDTYYDNHDRVMVFRQDHAMSGIPNRQFEDYVRQFPEIECGCRFSLDVDYSYKINPEGGLASSVDVQPMTLECDTTLRHIYNPRLIAGSWQAAETSANSFVLAEWYARKLFGSAQAAIGQEFWCNSERIVHRESTELPIYRVQAVIEDLPFNNTIQPFAPIAAWIMNDTDGRLQSASEYVYIYENRIMLREGIDPEQFAARVDQSKIRADGFDRPKIQAGQDKYCLSADDPYDIKRQFNNYGIFALVLLVIATPGLLVLLAALSNFFHLLISSIMMRRREYTLRRAHGAHTRDLWFMVSTQVIVTILIVGFGSMLVVELCSPIFSLKMSQINQFVLDRHEMLCQNAMHIGMLLVIGLLVAWVAVARIRKDSLQESMKTSTGRRPGRHIGRNLMLGWQMLIGFVFVTVLAATILQVRTNEREQLPWLTMQEKKEIVLLPQIFIKETKDAIAAELRAIPSAQEVMAVSRYALGFEFPAWSALNVLNAQGDTLEVCQMSSEANVLPSLRVPLLRGRWSERFDEILIDQNLVDRAHLDVGDQLDLLPESNGTRFVATDTTETYLRYATIVGVIDNVMEKSSINTDGNHWILKRGGIYFTCPESSGNFYVKAFPGKAEELKKALGELMHSRGYATEDSYCPYETVYDYIHSRNNVERQFLPLFWLFTVIALIITMLGIYSAITMDTTAHRKEMAIRKINGAKARDIALLFSRLYIIIIGIAAAIAFPLTYILFMWLSENGYRETFHFGFLFYAGIFLLMSFFVAVTIGSQVGRISRINPSQIVKSE